MKATRRFFPALVLACFCLTLVTGAVPMASALAQESALPGEALGLTGVSGFSAEWYRLYGLYRDAIDAYNEADPDMMLTPLGNAEIPFILGSSYDQLNPQGTYGRFEGTLGFTNRKAFLEKSGPLLSFGNEFVRDFDGFSVAERKGDLELEEGSLHLQTGHMLSRRSVTRSETEIERDTYEYKLLEGGGMSLIATWGDLYNFQGDEANRTEAVYLRVTEAGLDFIIARAYTGVAFTPVSLGDGDLLPEDARAAFEAAGFSVSISGTVQDGTVTIR
jgi:hypothetical protein